LHFAYILHFYFPLLYSSLFYPGCRGVRVRPSPLLVCALAAVRVTVVPVCFASLSRGLSLSLSPAQLSSSVAAECQQEGDERHGGGQGATKSPLPLFGVCSSFTKEDIIPAQVQGRMPQGTLRLHLHVPTLQLDKLQHRPLPAAAAATRVARRGRVWRRAGVRVPHGEHERMSKPLISDPHILRFCS
jgi:hypothetical protein